MARQRYSIQQLHEMQAAQPPPVATVAEPAPSDVVASVGEQVRATSNLHETTPILRSRESLDEQERVRKAANAAIAAAAAEKPIYPRELAERIAADYSKVSFPDWRLLKLENGGLYRQLVRDQPEMQQREVKQRAEIVALIRRTLPGHLVPLLHDLETIYGLIVTAQESAAFLVGYAMGKQAERVSVGSHGLLQVRRDQRQALRLSDGQEVRWMATIIPMDTPKRRKRPAVAAPALEAVIRESLGSKLQRLQALSPDHALSIEILVNHILRDLEMGGRGDRG